MPNPPYLARLLDLTNLDALKQEMTRLAVDKGGLPIMSFKGIQRMILIEQIPTAAANILKQEVLARGGDLVTPWTASGFDAPVVDVILMGNLTTLRSTLSKIYRQSVYDLPRIADVVQNVIVRTTPGYLPVASKAGRQGIVVEETLEDLMGGRIPLEPRTNRATGRPTLAPIPDHTWRFGELTYVLGIAGATWQRIEQVVSQGAHIVNIGWESTADLQSSGLSVQEEIDRALPLIERTRKTYPAIIIAIETQRAKVAEAALTAGAHLINDTGAMRRDPDMKRVAAESGAPIVLVHNQNTPASKDLLGDVARFLYEAMDEAVSAGVAQEQIIIDAGFGCGKTVHQDLLLTRRLRELTGFGRPLLYSPSRKPSIGQVLGCPESDPEGLLGTAAAVSIGIANGADIVRIHDVGDIVQCVKMTDALVRGYTGPDE